MLSWRTFLQTKLKFQEITSINNTFNTIQDSRINQSPTENINWQNSNTKPHNDASIEFSAVSLNSPYNNNKLGKKFMLI